MMNCMQLVTWMVKAEVASVKHGLAAICRAICQMMARQRPLNVNVCMLVNEPSFITVALGSKGSGTRNGQQCCRLLCVGICMISLLLTSMLICVINSLQMDAGICKKQL